MLPPKLLAMLRDYWKRITKRLANFPAAYWPAGLTAPSLSPAGRARTVRHTATRYRRMHWTTRLPFSAGSRHDLVRSSADSAIVIEHPGVSHDSATRQGLAPGQSRWNPWDV